MITKFERTIQKEGSSKVFPIPSKLLKAMGLDLGSKVIVYKYGDKLIVKAK